MFFFGFPDSLDYIKCEIPLVPDNRNHSILPADLPVSQHCDYLHGELCSRTNDYCDYFTRVKLLK